MKADFPMHAQIHAWISVSKFRVTLKKTIFLYLIEKILGGGLQPSHVPAIISDIYMYIIYYSLKSAQYKSVIILWEEDDAK